MAGASESVGEIVTQTTTPQRQETAPSAVEDHVRRLETALRRSEKLVLAGRVTASVIHEINNPAEAITNLAYLIAKNADDPEFVRSLAGQLQEQLIRIQYVTRQTLSFFRDTSQRRMTDLVALVEFAIRSFEPSLLSRRVDVRRQMPAVLIAAIYPSDFLQLVSNLLGNAVDAVDAGGSLCIRLRASHGSIRLTIADNGCGIPKPIRARLFEPFESSKSVMGNGLGLWICKSVAEKHGGRISWRSSTATETHGTTFSVSIAS